MDTSNLPQITSALTSLAITGAIVSVFAQMTKKWLEGKALRMLYVLGLSMFGGVVLYLFQFVPASFWQIAIAVYSFANTVFVLLMNWSKKPVDPTV